MKPGDFIGPYAIQGPLGSGGMGRVWRARDTRLAREVAIKQLSDPSLTTEAARRRVLQEGRAAAGLSHPNIAAIFDVLDTADGPAIVMEYVPGESLARHLERGAMPAAQALDIAQQIVEGLREAHQRGIIHRDLKPANIQITPDGKAKILDFGIARISTTDADRASAPTITSHTDARRLVGTPGYMSPEQLGGGRGDERTDIYAVGVLLYEMLTGRRPFPAGDLLGSAMAVLRGDLKPVGELVPATPPLVSALVARAMAREPGDRFQSAGELAAELKRVQVAMAAAPSPASAAPLHTTRRYRTAAALAAASLVLAAIGWGWATRDEPVIPATGSVFAVLPFTTPEADNAPIAVGLTEGVANRLSSLQSIRVLPVDDARTAARNRTAGAAAKALGAEFVVAGELRRSGQALDVDVSLVHFDGTRREVGRYTGNLAQTFDLHQRIAQGVIAQLAAANVVARATAPSPPPTANQEAFADYAQARSFLERSDVPANVDHAIRLFKSAIAKDDRFALAHAGLGQAYWAKYRLTDVPIWTTSATASILDALRIDDRQPEVRMSLAVMYQGLGRPKEAEQEVRRVLDMQPWNDDAHRLMAGLYIDRGQWDAALEPLRVAINLRPNYWRNHSELGFAHYRAGRHEEAVKAYTRVVDLQPDSALGFHMLGTVHQSAGRLEEALRNYEKANAIRPRSLTYSNVGTIHFWRGDYARAAEAYAHVVKLSPDTPSFHANLGDALQKLGRRQDAQASYRTAVEKARQQLAVNEKDSANLSRLALYLAKLQDRAGADATIAQALALNQEDGQVLYTAAMVDALAGRTAPACEKLTRALARGASPEFARRADELRALEGCAAYDGLAARQ
jgi:eukaryotic-like serine/threonine-protein kinase